MIWKSININIQNIKHKTGRAVLFNCPKNSNYAGYSFWHPAKLVRPGKHSYAVSVSYTNDFTFKLVKYGSGKTTKFKVIAETAITVEEFEEMFEVMNENITAPKEEEAYLKVEEPEALELGEVKVPDCLQNR